MQEEGNHILILFATSAALILLIVVLAFTFLTSYQKKIVSQRLHIQETENAFQQKLLRASLESQEKERKRIAADLHDEIGALLSGLKTNITYLEGIDHVMGINEKKFLARTGKLIDNGLSNVRRISYDLLPPTLVRFGLWEAVHELIKDLNYTQTISISADFESVLHLDFTEITQLAIFRTLKELISNSLHEGSVTEIQINTRIETDFILNYKDNGNGFTEEVQSQGLGIFTMQSRIKAISGEICFSGVTDDHFFARIAIPTNTLKDGKL